MVNDMGINPFEWFQSEKEEPPSWEDTAPSEYEPPDNKYAPPERRAELDAELNPRPEEKIAEWFVEKPDDSDEIEKEKTIHQKLYEIATAKYNPFSVGGSETLGGGSEQVQEK